MPFRQTFHFEDRDKANKRCFFETKHEMSHYKNGPYTRLDCHNYETVCIGIRYIHFMDTTDLIPSLSSHSIFGLSHNRPSGLEHVNIYGFDHTSQWRYKGDRFPRLILTEPYGNLIEKNLDTWDEYCTKFGLQYFICPATGKSLWNPNSTVMVFWWCPKYLDMKNPSQFMQHKRWDLLKKDISYD